MSGYKSSYKEKLFCQIRDAYGKVIYTERIQLEQYKYLEIMNKRIKYAQIILSAISTNTGFIVAFVTNGLIV